MDAFSLRMPGGTLPLAVLSVKKDTAASRHSKSAYSMTRHDLSTLTLQFVLIRIVDGECEVLEVTGEVASLN